MSKIKTGRYALLIGADFRKKSLLKIQALIYFLCFLFLCSMSIWLPNIKNIRKTEAMELYGSWHYGLFAVSEPCVKLIERNQLLEDAGQITTYGYLYDWQGRTLGSIGTMEESVVRLCQIEVLEGHLPRTDGEIALEQMALDQLGYSYELGQEITFVTGPAGMSVEEADEGEQVTYTLCGILENYSILFSQTRGIPTAIVSPEAAGKLSGEKQQGILFQVKEGCDAVSVQKELTAAIVANGYLEKVEWLDNFYVYGTDFIQNNAGWMQIVIVMTGFVMVFGLSFSYVVSERKRSGILETLGMTQKEIWNFFLTEQLLLWLITAGTGLLLGSVGVLSYLHYYKKVQEIQVSLFYPVEYLAVVCGGSSLVLLLGSLIGWLSARRGSTSRRLKEGSSHLPGPKKLQVSRKSAGFSLMWREIRVRRGSYIGFFLVETVLFFLTAVCIGGAYRNYEYYQLDRQQYICDFVVGQTPATHYMGHEARGCISEKLLERIGQIEGVERTETIYWNLGTELVDAEIREGEYYKAAEAYYADEEAGLLVPLITLEEGSQLVKDIGPCVDKGKWDKEKIAAGEEVVLYLPLRRYLSENSSIEVTYKGYLKNRDRYQSEYANWLEDQIEVGDFLTIKTGEKVKRVKVGGIIYSGITTQETGTGISSYPYSIYCGKSLFEEMTQDAEMESHSATYIFADDRADYLYTDKRVAQLTSMEGLDFENIRGGYLSQVKYRKMNLQFLTLTALTIMLLHVFCLLGFFRKQREKNQQNRKILYFLGARKRQLQKIYLLPYVFCMTAGAMVSFAAFIIYYYAAGKAEAAGMLYLSIKPAILMVGRDALANIQIAVQLLLIGGITLAEGKKL